MRFSTIAFLPLTFCLLASAAPFDKRAAFTKANGAKAKALNAKFATLKPNSKCTSGENACIGGKFAQCSGDKFVLTPCGGGTVCKALPLVNSPGTSVTCDSEADATDRIKVTGARRSEDPVAISRRIAQSDLSAVAQSWEELCLKSGGDTKTGDPCVSLAGQRGITALLAADDPCAQQDVADDMIQFAKSNGVTNKQALIDNAIAYRKHPRNALNIGGTTPSTPFCQKAPKNAELNGVVNKQLDGVDPKKFGGPNFPVVDFGAPGTCPFGQTADVKAGVCK